VTRDAIEQRPAELLQRLLRFDTTNPPGHERELLEWVRGLLGGLGCEVQIVARDPERPNLIARLAGRGEAPALLLQGHVDVVPASGEWAHPPFAGEIADGYIWGRGALDMKGGVAMMLAAFMRVAEGAAAPAGDLVLCLLSDEERGSDFGAEFLVAEHAGLFDGVRYAIGEFGGFTMEMGGQRFAPIMVAEKQILWARARLHGPAGHASMPVRGGAMGKLGAFLSRIDEGQMPTHDTPLAERMAAALGADGSPLVDAVRRNTVSVTGIRAGEAQNVIPPEVEVDLDMRLLPGVSADDAIAELRALTGVEFDIEIVRHDALDAEPDFTHFEMLAGILRELDPEVQPLPLLLPAVTDGRFFSRLGIQTYGFLPMQLPPGLEFMKLIHAPDERIPVDSLEYGTTAIVRAIERYA
jgi:acetylornithine deacetylase/succinyl-diaminopimelate desuccinylase-like protein